MEFMVTEIKWEVILAHCQCLVRHYVKWKISIIFVSEILYMLSLRMYIIFILNSCVLYKSDK